MLTDDGEVYDMAGRVSRSFVMAIVVGGGLALLVAALR